MGPQPRFFLRAPRGRAAAGRSTVPIVDVLCELVAAGYGDDPAEIARRYTWRQIERYWQAEQRRRRRRRADLIEAVAVGLGGKAAQAVKRLRE